MEAQKINRLIAVILVLAAFLGFASVQFGITPKAEAFSLPIHQNSSAVAAIDIDEFIEKIGYYNNLITKNGVAELQIASSPTCDKLAGTEDFTSNGVRADVMVSGLEVIERSSGKTSFVNSRGEQVSEEHALKAMLYNTWFLQNLMDCNTTRNQETNASQFWIYLPAGTFYFKAGGEGMYGNYVIRQASNVKLIGAGGKAEEESGGATTTLKPFSRAADYAADSGKYRHVWSSVKSGGLDMFHHNMLLDVCSFVNGEVSCKREAQYSYNNQKLEACAGASDDTECVREAIYLVNADYESFIIDSEHALAAAYDSSGKGFMIDVIRDSDWNNVVVRNTDGTGFGADNPVNSTIKNSKAENCGKMATVGDGGASGFGIGTGFSEKGSLTIIDSVAVGNTRFGFFFEHQSRFSGQDANGNIDTSHVATTAAHAGDAYVVVGGYSEGNRYNYGGMRANDVIYKKSESMATEKTVLHVYFTDESRRVSVQAGENNVKLDSGTVFEDVVKSAYYADAIKWAEEKGISGGVGRHYFGVGEQLIRADAVVLIWRALGREGDVLTWARQGTKTCFSDVAPTAYYAAAVKWAYGNGLVQGTTACSGNEEHPDGIFTPERSVSRAEFVTMLWRLAGEPAASGSTAQFSDVEPSAYYYDAVLWARGKGITSGVDAENFGPDWDCTREQAVTLLYRYFH